MPELPEVETTKTSLEPLIGCCITQVMVYQSQLRWAIPEDVHLLVGQTCIGLQRRSKYILAQFSKQSMLWHLGMSGSFRIADIQEPLRKHDHFILRFQQTDGKEMELRYHDPRRFGCILWLTDETQHKLLDKLGVEPLSDAFTADYLQEKLAKRSTAIKAAIMDASIVVGVGNIYATESLFNLGIHPLQPAKNLTQQQIEQLVIEIKRILAQAIALGGSTLKDFSNAMGENGYFQQTLLVYGRAGEACIKCKTTLETIKIAQRSSVFCPICQPFLTV